MELLKNIFLEQPLPFYLVAGLAELITFAVWFSLRSRRTRILLAIWPAVALLAGSLAWLVETDREKVQACWAGIRAGIETRDAARVMANIAGDFRGDGLDKARLGILAESALPLLKKDEVAFQDFRIEDLTANYAKTTLVVNYNGLGHPFPSQWEVLLAPQPDGRWRVTSARCLQPSDLDLTGAANALRRVKNVPRPPPPRR